MQKIRRGCGLGETARGAIERPGVIDHQSYFRVAAIVCSSIW